MADFCRTGPGRVRILVARTRGHLAQAAFILARRDEDGLARIPRLGGKMVSMRTNRSLLAVMVLGSGLAWIGLPTQAGVTGGDGGTGGSFSDPGAGASALPPITGRGDAGDVYSPPPIDHDTPETASSPTVVGTMDPGRLDPVISEASRIDYGLGDDPQVLGAGSVKDTGLWKTLQEIKLNPLTVVAGSLALVLVVTGSIVALSRRGAAERARRLTEAGPPVYFEGDITFEPDRDALAKQEQRNADEAVRLPESDPNQDMGPRRRESALQ